MNKKGLTLLSAICFLVAAIIFFLVAKNIVPGICFAVLGIASFARFIFWNKKNKND